MHEALRNFVRQRAHNRCEYCQLAEAAVPFLSFQIDHIIARQHGGTDDAVNLAIACQWCNLHKGPNLAGIDPTDQQIVPLFNPRQQNWSEHFTFQGVNILGSTATGRATVRVLKMNAPERIELRLELLDLDD